MMLSTGILHKLQNAGRSSVSKSARRLLPTSVQAVRNSSSAESRLHPSESFLNGTNSVYMEEMYRVWKENPAAVHKSWDIYFRNVDSGMGPGQAFMAPPQLQPGVQPVASAGAVNPAEASSAYDKIRIMHLVRAFQVRGHERSLIDPLGLMQHRDIPELDYKTYGFTEQDLDKEFDTTGFANVKGFLGVSERASLRVLLDRLKACYCGTMAVEYMHIQSREKCNWLRERLEFSEIPKFGTDKRKQILDRLTWADSFERFLANKYTTAKRFGLEGAESLICGTKALVDRATELGVENIVFGMPHRGRLNVLTNVIRKPAEVIFKEFQGTHVDMERYLEQLGSGDWSGSGDVKYHLGTSFDRTYPDGRKIHLALVANPSHLEAVNPVVVGKTRAKQDYIGDDERDNSMGVLMHGDAAFAGQGVVYETMQMSQLKNYTTGGTVHVIVNNQVGFTTDPKDSRSTRYCSDLGKTFDVPVFHVNADDPEAVVRAFEIAADYRQTFKEDVIIDLIGFRRHGHNELDQPEFTQPKMYKVINNHKSALVQYQERLQNEGILSKEEIDGIQDRVWQMLSDKFEASKSYPSDQSDWLSSRWKGFFRPNQLSDIRETGAERSELELVGKTISEVPEDLKLHSSLKRIMKAKAQAVQAGKGLDWATAEALAFGTLMREGFVVRMSGQDVERGTFSHRHSVLHDQETNATYIPLNKIPIDEARFIAESERVRRPWFLSSNSFLSEFGVLGFELGYSLEAPDQLVLWEAQFGDFVNGAQVIIDQFICSGEAKWYRQAGLVMLLPHGYDGQGPEHSSSRYERFLQLVDEQEDVLPSMKEDGSMQIQHCNIQVVNPTTPANYFHVLRRQVHRNFRKPLIVVSPKNLLRHKKAVSSFEEMEMGTHFSRVIPDDSELSPSHATVKPEEVRRLLLCTGKVYYELEKAREDGEHHDIAITRVEQLAPFPFDQVAEEVKKYPNAEIVWVQEEPRNMGAWNYVAPRIATATRELVNKEIYPVYVGRLAAAAPATGVPSIHEREQTDLIKTAMSVDTYGSPVVSHDL